MNYKLAVLFLLSANCFQCSECFLANIGESITNGIKSAFWWAVNGVASAVKNTTIWAANKIRNTVSVMATDMFAALAAAGEGVRDKANETLSEIVDSVKLNQTAVLLKMMHTGLLPKEYYFRKIYVDVELAFLDQQVELIRNLAIVCGVTIGACVICMFALFCCYCMLKKDMQKLDELEKEKVKKLTKVEMKRRKKAMMESKEKAEKRRQYRQLMMKGGIMGYAKR